MRLIDADKIIFREIDEIGGEYEPYLGCSKSQIDSLPSITPQEPTTKNDLGVDLISRADVNRLICEYRDDAAETGNERDLERAYGANAVGELISELPSVTQQEPRWIPVSERLPEELHSVLVYCPTTNNIYCAFLENGKWFIFYAEEQPQINEIVIAWMPLPPCYEPQESEG